MIWRSTGISLGGTIGHFRQLDKRVGCGCLKRNIKYKIQNIKYKFFSSHYIMNLVITGKTNIGLIMHKKYFN